MSVPSSELGPPPTPSPAVSVYPPLNQRRGKHTRLRVRVGESQFGLLEKRPSTLSTFCRWISGCALNTQLSVTYTVYLSLRYNNCAQPNRRLHRTTTCTCEICIIVWKLKPEYKAPSFLFISDPDSNPDPKSGSETGSEMFISVPDRIRPKVSDPYGSGSATLTVSTNLIPGKIS